MAIKVWKLGVVSGPLSILAVPTPPADPSAPAEREQIAAGLVGVSDAGVTTLSYPAYDPSTQQAPDETRVYAVPLGDNGAPVEQPPADGQGYIDSALPYASTTAPVPVEGAAAYIVPVPAACQVDVSYLFQVLHGYA